MYDILHRVNLDNDAILAQLLLDEYDLLSAFDHKIPARVERTFRHAGQLSFCPSRQNAFVTLQHDGKASNIHVGSPDDGFASGVLDSDENGRTVRDVTKPAFMGCNALVDGVRVRSVGEAHDNIGVFEPETGIDIGGDLVVSLEDIFDVNVDEVIERVDVLLDESLDLEKGREQQPFVLRKEQNTFKMNFCERERPLGVDAPGQF